MQYLLPIKIDPLEEGGCLATSEVLPWFLAQGRTIAETLEIAQDVARKLIKSCVQHGGPLRGQLLLEADRRDGFDLCVPVPVVA